jgi:hypothetical protein
MPQRLLKPINKIEGRGGLFMVTKEKNAINRRNNMHLMG